MRGIICFAHKRDLDGIGCHAIIKRHAKKHGISVENVYVDYNELIGELIRRKSLRNKIFIIADLGFTNKFSENIKVFREISLRNEFYWIDHHEWDEYKEVIENLNIRFLIRKDKCASEIIHEFFEKGDPISEKISKYARLHDFMIIEDKDFMHALKLYEVIASHMLDYDYIAEELSKGNFWNEKFEEAYEFYQITKRKELEYCRRNLKLYKVGDLKFGITLYKNISATTVAMNLLNEYDLDFIICCTKKGRLSFRRKNKKIDMVKISKLFNGGGREDASSASLNRDISIRDFDSIASRIIDAFKRGFNAV